MAKRKVRRRRVGRPRKRRRKPIKTLRGVARAPTGRFVRRKKVQVRRGVSRRLAKTKVLGVRLSPENIRFGREIGGAGARDVARGSKFAGRQTARGIKGAKRRFQAFRARKREKKKEDVFREAGIRSIKLKRVK